MITFIKNLLIHFSDFLLNKNNEMEEEFYIQRRMYKRKLETQKTLYL